MKYIIAAISFLLISSPAFAGTAYLKGEKTTGMTKQCFYDYMGSQYTITIKNYELCPYTIQVNT
jgi:hypothetical protein